MQKTIEVVYEDGVFKPLEKVNLRQGEKIEMEIKEDKIKKLSDKYFGIVKLNFKKEELRKVLNKIEEEHYGINKIATTDPDFKRVDFLEIIAPE